MKNIFVHVAACFIASTGVCAANTGQTLDLGTVTTYQTARLDATANLAQPYNTFEQKVTFSLSSDATVRIDMRELGKYHFLVPVMTASLRVDSFTLANSDQQLIGTATTDPTFTAKVRNWCGTGSKCTYEFASGYTLTKALAAGSYTMDLQGYWVGADMPELDFGVLVVGAGDQTAYLGALTRPTDLPEPSAWLLMALGLGAMGWRARIRRTA